MCLNMVPSWWCFLRMLLNIAILEEVGPWGQNLMFYRLTLLPVHPPVGCMKVLEPTDHQGNQEC